MSPARTPALARWPRGKLIRCNDGQIRPLVSVQGAARHLGMSQSTVRRRFRSRLHRIGGRVFIAAIEVYRESAR